MTGLSKMGVTLGDPFKQKGGNFGLAIIAIAIIAILFNISALVTLAQNIFWLIGYGIAIAAILYVAFDKNFRLALSTWYMIKVRWFMGFIVKMDPISILKDGIQKMYKKISEMEFSMGKLNGVRLALKDKIKQKKSDFEDCMARVKAAEKQGKKDLALIEKRQATRLYDLTISYQEMSDSAEKWYNTMSKIAEMAKLYAQDSENEVNAQEERYKMIKLSHSAFKSAMSVIKGNPDELALYNQAFQFVNDDIMNRVGEMDRVVNTAGGLLDKIDVEKEIFNIKGDDIMKKYNEIGIEAMFGGLKTPPATLALMRGEKQTTLNDITFSTDAEKLPNEGNYNLPGKSKYL